MSFKYQDSLRNILTHYTDQTIGILLATLVIMLTAVIAYWFYNRRKLRELSHQIPATVVKNYLDSIITNSNALKSSLFRGGGLDVEDGIPSVVPASSLPVGNVAISGGSSEELNQKNAEISSLKTQLVQRDKTVVELEKSLKEEKSAGGAGGGDSAELKAEIDSLQGKLNDALAEIESLKSSAGSEPSGDNAELEAITKERDELKERLMEYEIIEEDLANLKRFQQENEELKRTIEKMKEGGAAPVEEPAPVEEAPAEPVEVAEPPPEVTAEENPAASDEGAQAAAEEMPDVPTNEGEQKSAEELLSEFEKMLG